MKKQIILEWEKRILSTEKEETQVLLNALDNLYARTRDMVPVEAGDLKNVDEPVRRSFVGSIITKIKQLAEKIVQNNDSQIESIYQRIIECEEGAPKVYPNRATFSKHYYYEIIDDVEYYGQFAETLSYDYLAEARAFLVKHLENLDRRVKHAIRNLSALMVDRRAHFRSIVRLLFKNMDDEHSAVNNTAEINQMSYLQLKIRYGIRKYQKIKGGSIRLAIAE